MSGPTEAETEIYHRWRGERADTPELRREFFASIERLIQAGLLKRAAPEEPPK